VRKIRHWHVWLEITEQPIERIAQRVGSPTTFRDRF
jgi:hypothetical protein